MLTMINVRKMLTIVNLGSMWSIFNMAFVLTIDFTTENPLWYDSGSTMVLCGKRETPQSPGP
jgi:hypothetical protein